MKRFMCIMLVILGIATVGARVTGIDQIFTWTAPVWGFILVFGATLLVSEFEESECRKETQPHDIDDLIPGMPPIISSMTLIMGIAFVAIPIALFSHGLWYGGTGHWNCINDQSVGAQMHPYVGVVVQRGTTDGKELGLDQEMVVDFGNHNNHFFRMVDPESQYPEPGWTVGIPGTSQAISTQFHGPWKSTDFIGVRTGST